MIRRLVFLLFGSLIWACSEPATAPVPPVRFDIEPGPSLLEGHCHADNSQHAVCSDHETAVDWILNEGGTDCSIYHYYADGDVNHTRQVICQGA